VPISLGSSRFCAIEEEVRVRLLLRGVLARHPRDADRWRGRPALALLVRGFVLLGPLAFAAAVTAATSASLAAPSTFSLRLLLWLGLIAEASAMVWAMDHLLRRLLPLAALLEMSVLFPGQAPSRFAVAREAGGTRRLETVVARAQAADLRTQPVVAATRILALVGALRAHDRGTRGHSERVRVYTDMLAAQLGLSTGDRDRLRWAALLHDVGKLTIPSEILNDAGKPTVTEWELLTRHPAAGEELIRPLLPWLREWGAVVIQHHERWDGTGYPAGLASTRICLGARIVAVADSFEVMTAARAYKRPMSRAAALRELTTCSGSQFDPAVVRAFLEIGAPRLRWAAGPLAWVVQLPFVGPATSWAGGASGLVGHAAVGVGALSLGTAVSVVGPAGPFAQFTSAEAATGSSPAATGHAAVAGPTQAPRASGAVRAPGWGPTAPQRLATYVTAKAPASRHRSSTVTGQPATEPGPVHDPVTFGPRPKKAATQPVASEPLVPVDAVLADAVLVNPEPVDAVLVDPVPVDPVPVATMQPAPAPTGKKQKPHEVKAARKDVGAPATDAPATDAVAQPKKTSASA
jgi:HD-GYP domain-containing protein (c-di-GMP phosphodiesterase class II)